MATFNLFDNFIAAAMNKKYDLANDQLVVALSNVLPTAAGVDLTDITQISYTNCTSRDVTTTSSSQTSGAYKLILEDLLVKASGGPVATYNYVILTNPTAVNNELIGWSDCGSTTLLDGEGHLIDLNQVAGAIAIS